MAMESQSQLPEGISSSPKVYIGTSAIMTFLSTVFVGLRLSARILTIKIKQDDWACVGALVFGYGLLITTVLLATIGHRGYDRELYDQSTLAIGNKLILANNIIYTMSVSLAKISVLLFYRRIFAPSKPFLQATVAMGALVIGYWVAAIFGLIFAYSPIEAQFEPWLPNKSINTEALWMSTGIINMLLDISILLMPQPLVWRLQMSCRRKTLLSIVFSLGSFVCIASILRVYYISDITNNLYFIGMWTMIETNMSIICFCLPLLPSLVNAFRLRLGRGTKLLDAGHCHE
ncbi:hypothetical protein BDV06DRAFT_228558 [Aspergillus oleicola]